MDVASRTYGSVVERSVRGTLNSVHWEGFINSSAWSWKGLFFNLC